MKKITKTQEKWLNENLDFSVWKLTDEGIYFDYAERSNKFWMNESGKIETEIKDVVLNYEIDKFPVKFENCDNLLVSNMQDVKNTDSFPRKVKHVFMAGSCGSLESLDCFPDEVETLIFSGYNKMKSMSDIKTKFKNLDMTDWNLEDLQGMPDEIEGNVKIQGFELTSLKGISKHIGGNLTLYKCKKLKDISALENIKVDGIIAFLD